MRALVIGQNTKMANVLSCFCDEVSMAVDRISNYRCYSENSRFRQIETGVKNIRSAKAILPRWREIRRWVKETGADLVFTNDKFSMIAARLAQLTPGGGRFKHVSTSHNSYAWLDEGNVQKFAKLADATCDGYVAMSSFAYEGMVKGGVKERKLILLPNSLETGLFKAKESYEIKDGVCRMVYTAVMYPGKGQHLAIMVLGELKRRGLRGTLDFYGEACDAEYYATLQRLVKDEEVEDSVRFHGRVANEELRERLREYDVYICPTQMEMSPFNVLEAQQAALPIVASRVGGIPDLVEDGRNGLLCEWGDVKEFADAVECLVGDCELREKIGKGEQQWVNEVNTPENAALRLKRFIEEL